jgi:hypothetical protein
MAPLPVIAASGGVLRTRACIPLFHLKGTLVDLTQLKKIVKLTVEKALIPAPAHVRAVLKIALALH